MPLLLLARRLRPRGKQLTLDNSGPPDFDHIGLALGVTSMGAGRGIKRSEPLGGARSATPLGMLET